ncbi:MarR family transcriptional regulator [Salinivibrio kushneri]|uniref:MarR family transcriptional regulator n=1 Tax=Salinivibrio kushneri TaxID=1908198 RepID=UPI000989515F|nr:MarR family transcriptional regulator [Salinivibrio kushneri]OOE34105.1 MarR family transcriptional regulator [Salinivibrio kushneri]
MKISHKRKVQLKLNKRVKASSPARQRPVKSKPVAAAKPAAKPAAKAPVASAASSLTPKQQQVLEIVQANPDGINPKGIGLAAGQEDTKAASWATGALKKLTEEGAVERVQVAANKVIYKAC